MLSPLPAGPTAVLLHGVPTSPALWDGVVHALPAGAPHILRPTLPGYAGTPPLADMGVESHLRWFGDQLDAAGLHSPEARGGLHLVGQDYGGLLAAAWAARHGARSLTLTSTAISLAWMPARITAWPGLRWFFYRRYEGSLWLSQGVEDEVRDEFLSEFEPLARAVPGLAEHMEATAHGLSIPLLLGLPAALKQSGVPVLALWGANDRFLPVRHARALAGTLPGARLRVLPRGRHFLPWEQAEPYAAALIDHWRRTDVRLE